MAIYSLNVVVIILYTVGRCVSVIPHLPKAFSDWFDKQLILGKNKYLARKGQVRLPGSESHCENREALENL